MSITFGDRVIIEQKRHGVENEHYFHKVINTIHTNGYVDVPVQTPAENTLHKDVVPVVLCVTEGISKGLSVSTIRNHTPSVSIRMCFSSTILV